MPLLSGGVTQARVVLTQKQFSTQLFLDTVNDVYPDLMTQ